ncbi:unnamed protein product [Owenia fusiformis]|uniref:NADP-dependent oxidoreductase domain-containing protein n=1 Tax=Owenia fusiformis TaxID=6347 RepID=A0A8S4ND02_OWEFU|nr:unnamed protein product [Owenia fusiformis]
MSVTGLTESVTLHNGVQMPKLGLGSSPHGGYEHDSVVYALTEVGYRHIDTAKRYMVEEEVRESIKASGLKREDLWVTSKLWPTGYGYEKTLRTFHGTLKRLGLEYLDLYLMHWPNVLKGDQKAVHLDTWRAMEEIYNKGLARAIGVSNFSVEHLENIIENANIKPMVNQIELHPYNNPKELVDFCRKAQIQLEAYCPLARAQMFDDPTLVKMAEKYKKTGAQILLRWSIQNGFVTVPKSVKKKRIFENSQIFDFSLSQEDMDVLNGLIIPSISPQP